MLFRKLKLGLALGGGGAKGAYQAGVLNALDEAGLLTTINIVAGTSIGSINALLVTSGAKGADIVNTWFLLNNETIYDKPLQNILLRKGGIFNTTKISEKLKPVVNLKQLRESKMQGYAIVSKGKLPSMLSLFKRRNDQNIELDGFTMEEFHLNSANNPFDVVLASSAIPLIFGAKEVDGETYYDGGIVDNIPYATLINKGCDVILTVALNENFHKEDVPKSVRLLDFSPATSLGPFPKASLDFNEKDMITRMNMGYEHSVRFINYLRKHKYLTKRNKFKLKKGVHLSLKDVILQEADVI